MAIYAIGDIHGCYESLQKILSKSKFDLKKDTLCLVGDLINRGKNSLKVLELVRELGDRAITVLGNHEISLISAYYKVSRPHSSVEDILAHKDCDEMIDWLRKSPLLYIKDNFCLTHAGINPHWNLEEAKLFANEIEEQLRGDNTKKFFQKIGRMDINNWSENLAENQRWSYILSSFTRMRYLNKDGSMDWKQKSGISDNLDLIPWFKFDGKRIDKKIVFGHWASLGLYLSQNVIGLDSGCVWGGKLTMVKLDNMRVNQIECVI